VFFDEGSAKLAVPDWAKKNLDERVGKEVVLGVRPEGMDEVSRARFQTRDRTLSMRVTLVQLLGDRMDVYLATDRHPHSVAQVQAYPGVKPGDVLSVAFDPERMHFFEPGELGERIGDNAALPRGGLAS
jgi:multiple sugar transport system ATP-binding protein